SRRLPTRTARLDIGDQRAAAGKSETRVTVKPHPGPSFDCEPSQTHSLEGGPDDLLSRPQPVEARHLDRRLAELLVRPDRHRRDEPPIFAARRSNQTSHPHQWADTAHPKPHADRAVAPAAPVAPTRVDKGALARSERNRDRLSLAVRGSSNRHANSERAFALREGDTGPTRERAGVSGPVDEGDAAFGGAGRSLERCMPGQVTGGTDLGVRRRRRA